MAAIRVPVKYRYDAINPDFMKMLAEIGSYADEKYGAFDQYAESELTGEKSPINHIYEHLRQYVSGERYDHFEGDPTRHLAAIAYNAMMQFLYHKKFGHRINPLVATMRSAVESKSCSTRNKRATSMVGLRLQEAAKNLVLLRGQIGEAKKRRAHAKRTAKNKRARGRTSSRKG